MKTAAMTIQPILSSPSQNCIVRLCNDFKFSFAASAPIFPITQTALTARARASSNASQRTSTPTSEGLLRVRRGGRKLGRSVSGSYMMQRSGAKEFTDGPGIGKRCCRQGNNGDDQLHRR